MSQPSNLHIDSYLTNYSQAYKNEAMIWERVMPVVTVGKRSDKYSILDKENAYREADDHLGPNALPNEVGITYSNDNYSVESHGLGDWLAQEDIENADAPIALEVDVVENLSNTLDLKQERRVAALVFAAASYPAGNKVQLSGTGQWSGAADAPLSDVQTAVETCFMRANTLVFGIDAWLVFRRLPEIVEAVRAQAPQTGAVNSGFVTAPEVASLFEVANILVGRARVNTAKPGQTASYARVWGKHMSALHVGPNVGLKTISFAKTFSTQMKTTFRDFDGRRGEKGSHYYKVAWNSDEKITASDVGYFIEDAVA